MTRFIAYYRVSTDKQGRSGLGLDAQRQAVTDFVAGRGALVAEFTEVESTRHQRPQLEAALAACRRQKATLLIARLDRLARNVAFIGYCAYLRRNVQLDLILTSLAVLWAFLRFLVSIDM